MNTSWDVSELRAAGAGPVVEVHSGDAAILDGLEADWRRLCDEASNDEPFYRPEWIRAYVRAFVPAAKLVVVTCRAGGRLTGVLPLVSDRAFFCGLPVRRLRSASNVHSCRFDLLRAAGPEGDAAVGGIWQQVRNLRGWDLLHFMDTPDDGALPGLVALAGSDGHLTGRWEAMRTPVLPLAADGPEPWFAQTSPDFRSNMRRKSRRLSERGALSIQRIDSADKRWLEAFYALERSGWKGASNTAIVCSAATTQFYDEIAAAAAQFGYLALYFVHCGADLVSAQYGLSYRGRYFMPKIAMDASYKPYGPGHVVIHSVLRDCVTRGISLYDFIGPSDEYKTRWTRVTRPHTWFWVFQRSAYGQLLHAVKFAVIPGLKHALERLRLRSAVTPGTH